MRRHDLATIRPGASIRSGCGALSDAAQTRVRGWIDAGLPLVVARQTGGDKRVALGLALPPGDGKQKLSCHFDISDVSGIRGPLSILECLSHLPGETVRPLTELAAALESEGMMAGVYGSVSWEILSGLSYRTSESDIDLICDVTTTDQLSLLLSSLKSAQAGLSCRLDGEVRFPDGFAVAWRELEETRCSASAEVLVKGHTDVKLIPTRELLDQLREAVHEC